MASYDHGQGHTKSGTPGGLLVMFLPLSFRYDLLTEKRTPVDGFSPPLSWGCTARHLSPHPCLWKCGLLFHHFPAGLVPVFLITRRNNYGNSESFGSLLRLKSSQLSLTGCPLSCLNVTPLSNKSNQYVP